MKLHLLSNTNRKPSHSSWSAMPRFIKNAFIKKYALAFVGIFLSIFAYFIIGSFRTPVAIFLISLIYVILIYFEYRHISNGSLISIELICKNVDYQVKSFWKFSLASTTKITLYFKGVNDNKVYFLLSANSQNLRIGDRITIYLFPQDLHISDNDTFYISSFLSIQKIKNTELL